MRLFIAILLSDEMKDALTEAQNELYDRGVRGNYTPEENMHLTLAFIGEYPDAAPVLDALSAVAGTDSVSCPSLPFNSSRQYSRSAAAASTISADRESRTLPRLCLSIPYTAFG